MDWSANKSCSTATPQASLFGPFTIGHIGLFSDPTLDSPSLEIWAWFNTWRWYCSFCWILSEDVVDVIIVAAFAILVVLYPYWCWIPGEVLITQLVRNYSSLQCRWLKPILCQGGDRNEVARNLKLRVAQQQKNDNLEASISLGRRHVNSVLLVVPMELKYKHNKELKFDFNCIHSWVHPSWEKGQL